MNMMMVYIYIINGGERVRLVAKPCWCAHIAEVAMCAHNITPPPKKNI